MSDVLARFHGALVEEILARRPEYLHAPFTVAEIYQNLVPYGTHRDRIGVEMNGDYEDALLRLLAGEGGFLVLDSDPALRTLREELDSQNPNTGLYRDFAAVDVRLNPARTPAGGSGPSAEPASFGAEAAPVAMEDLAPEQGAPAAVEAPAPHEAGPEPVWDEPAPPSAVDPEPDVAPATQEEASTTCRWCRADLPARANLNFCPFCGTDVHVVPCPGCGEELDPEWRFCIACGTEVGG